MFQKYMIYLLATLLLFAASCAPKSSGKSKKPSEVISDNPTSPPPNSGDPIGHICTTLNFQGVTWPMTLSFYDNTHYALALNITGSFEGHVGWKSIAGNFDGQGISLGLLQQNLGQGSLQPLLINMYRQAYGVLQANFTAHQLSSMKTMLEEWLNDDILNPGVIQAGDEEFELFPEVDSLNELDESFRDDRKIQLLGTQNIDEQVIQAIGNSSKSVTWARKTALDSSGNVTATWMNSFQAMADSGAYRSQQLSASVSLFLKAKAYFETFKFRELRFLLLMFDFVVQNGGLSSQHLKIYEKWLKDHSKATDEERAFAILEARLTTVKPQFKDDVKARKTTLIKTKGVVHGASRDLAREYCFNPRIDATH